MTQLTHMGHRTYNYAARLGPAPSASGMSPPIGPSPGSRMTRDLARITRDFAETALRCRRPVSTASRSPPTAASTR